MSKTLYVVANRLPITVGEQIKKSSGGLVAALEGLSADQFTVRWIGWPGGEVTPDRQREIERQLDSEYNATALFLSSAESVGYYEGLSNASLWPLLHSMPTRFRFETAWWEAYAAVNRRFADHALREVKSGDLVWVQDYQLMLVPALLRQAIVRGDVAAFRIGFFLHTPFPPYEIFRCHPRSADLLAGLLGADVVGFHTFGYLRNYRDAVLRGMGIQPEMMGVPQPTHVARLGVYPIGINAERFAKQSSAPDHTQKIAELTANYAGKRLIVSVERLDYTKGILHRLDAIDAYLARYDGRDELKFLFVSVPSRENVDEYKDLREEVETRVGRINGKYATLKNSPVHFIHGSVAFADLAASYASAAVAVVTPLVDGMNLVAKEYVAAQAPGRPGGPGVLILSEFAGAAEELFDALLVNPYDVDAVADAIARALAMPEPERTARMASMRRRVFGFDAQRWANAFIDDLTKQPDACGPTAGIADGCRIANDLRRSLADGKVVALFLDYDGTLTDIVRDPAAAKPNDDVRRLLDLLAGRHDVRVTLISGRAADDLEAWFGQYPFALVAEHGAAVRRGLDSGWEDLAIDGNDEWRQEVLKRMRAYEASTPGSFVEEKRSGLVWHYRRADPEFGTIRAGELMSELSSLVANLPLEVRHGRKIVEVGPTATTKAAAVTRLAAEWRPDVTLCAGDDATDESMFRLDLPGLATVKVGDGPTRAQARVPSPHAFRRLLESALRPE